MTDTRPSGARAQPVSPESKNTDLQNKGQNHVHRFRVCPLGAPRNDVYWN
jgi:hypothetical protein